MILCSHCLMCGHGWAALLRLLRKTENREAVTIHLGQGTHGHASRLHAERTTIKPLKLQGTSPKWSQPCSPPVAVHTANEGMWQVTIAHVAETKECMSRVQAWSHIIFSCCHTFTSHTSLWTLTNKPQIRLQYLPLLLVAVCDLCNVHLWWHWPLHLMPLVVCVDAALVCLY